MVTKKLIILLTILMNMVGIKAFAYAIAVENADGVTIYYNYINDKKELEVTEKYSNSRCYSGDVVIPEEVTYKDKTLKVTRIGMGAFSQCYYLTSITIPNSVTSIRGFAFEACTDLTHITIPNSVTEIGRWAFARCNGLTSITIPNSVTSIGDHSFYENQTITSIKISENLTNIEEYAFAECSGLISLTIPNGVVSIGECAFESCTGLVDVTIGNTVRSIGRSAFLYCSSLTSVTIGKSATSIGTYAFSGCSSLTSFTVDKSNPVYKSEDGVLFNKDGTTLLTYPIGKTKTAYTIPNSVTEIGSWAFEECSSLTSVTIGNSVTSIGAFAFDGCSGLTSVNISDLEAWCKIAFNSNPLNYAHHLFLNGEEIKDLVIPNSVTSIGNIAFYECSGLTSVTISNSVTSIGDRAFSCCDMLSDVISLIENPFPIYNTVFDSNTYLNTTLYVPLGTIDNYKAKEPWNRFTNIKEGLPSKIEVIDSNCAIVLKRYTIDGTVIKNPNKGINIIQMNNGTTQKVLVK